MSLSNLIPVSEECVLRVIELLRGISRDNGYAHNATLERLEEDGNAAGVENYSLQIILDESAPADAPDVTPMMLDGYRMTIGIGLRVLSSTPDDDVPIQRELARAYADVRKAIDTDRQLSGLAVNTEIGQPDLEFGMGQIVHAVLPLDVLFWTKRNDPYTLPGA